jgi:hypothetical protein
MRDARPVWLLALLPGLFWTGGPETAPALKRAGIEATRLSVEALHARTKLTPPGIDRKVTVASATTAPWVNANGWQIRRAPGREFWYDLPVGSAPLAAAEAFAYGANAVLKIAPADLDAFARMLQFLRTIPDRDLPDVADFGFIDDGSDNAGELLNLLNRRNLLYRILRAPDPKLRLNVKPDGDDPHLFAAKVREKLSDDQRSLRVYGSEVVLCRLQANDRQARIHVLNYSRNNPDGVRLRIKGSYARGKLYGSPKALVDYSAADGFTEFSLPELSTYAVVDLAR